MSNTAKYHHMNIHTFSMHKMSKVIDKLEKSGLGKQWIKETLYGCYGLYCIAFFGHKGTPYKKRKVKEINWFVENYELL
jgi:hypothetical protein